MKRDDKLSSIISEEIKMITAGKGPETVEGELNVNEYSIIRSVMSLKKMVDSEAEKFDNGLIGEEYQNMLYSFSESIDYFIRNNGLRSYFNLLSGK